MRLFRRNLKFDDAELESAFLDDYFDKSITTVRVALILGTVLYSSFGILDNLIAPLSRNIIWFIRFGIVVPCLLSVLVLSYFNIFRRHMQVILTAQSLIAGMGIVFMIGIALDRESALFYYAGLMLVMMWSYTFVKLRFAYAAFSCWIIVLGYEITAIVYKGMLSSSQMIPIFINNNFFFLSSNIIGMFACYLIELYSRKDFLQRRELADRREELQSERNELKTRIDIMNDELEMARLIQQNLIPDEQPDEHIFSLYKPMEAVGGDLLDFIKFNDDNRIGIFVSDVSGHGVPAALITSMIKSSILESKRIASNPAHLLSHLNQILANQTGESFVTAFYGIYDYSNRSIVYSNAGHHPPAIILKNRIVTLDRARSIPLAIMTNEDMAQTGNAYVNSRAILPERSKILLYTDGLVEAKNINNRKIDFSQSFNERILKLKKLDSREFIQTLYGELALFRGSESFDDDICIICVDIE